MKLIKLIMLLFVGAFLNQEVAAQANVSLNMLTLNSGDVIINGSGTLQITLNNTGPTSTIPAGRLQVQVTVPTSISIPAPQTISGYTFTSLNAQTVNICNSGTAIPVGGASTFTIALLGGATATTGVISGQTTFRTNCTAPGSLAGNNTADDAATAGFQVVAGAACNITGANATPGIIACNGGTTTLTVSAATSGATSTLEYSIGGAFQSSGAFTGVAAGAYTYTVREAANTACSATGSITVSQPTAVAAAGSVTTPIPTVGGTGVITINATGGTSPYTGTGTFNRTAGTYSFTVTDANGCTGTTSVTINDPAACILTSVSAAAGTILCNGGTTTITATPVGLTGAGVEYRLGAGAYQSSNVFTAVVAGTYTVTAREVSNPGCSVSTSVTVSQPAAVSATAAVSTPIALPGGTGAITVNATGGTGAYAYVTTTGTTINASGAASGVFSSLLAGSYTFTVTDANGCASAATAAVNLANPGIATADPAVGGMYFTTTGGGVQNANTLQLAPSTAFV
ncbi:MAG: hypothetical protein IPP72_16055 [Chitinophagaceae bacterium]|nr:hypothetical protein [Chitinophagaceae bacterium]